MTSLNQQVYLEKLTQFGDDVNGDFGCKDRLIQRLSSKPEKCRDDQFLTTIGSLRDFPEDDSLPIHELSLLVADIALELYGTDFLAVLPESRKPDLKKHYSI